MGRVGELLDKSKETISNDGVAIFAKKSAAYVKRHITRDKSNENNDPEKLVADVLFINGCFLPHPSRYRVSHQREQLLATNIVSNEVFYENVTLEMVKNYRVFIFFRCPITDTIKEFIELAKQYNKKVLFDIDDLVIDKKYTDQIKYLKTLSKEEKDGYDDGVNRMQETLRMCDGAITSTERLAAELRNYVPEVYINRNTASDRMLELSEHAIYNRDKLPYINTDNLTHRSEKKQYKKSCEIIKGWKGKEVRLGYFSGSITHNDDFNMILPVIARIMKEYSNVVLHVVGELDIPKELEPFKERVVGMPFCDWQKLPELIASVDINLVPLEQSIFNEAKSENKWVEASLVKVVTIASNVGALKDMMVDSETGLLCDNNEDDWYNRLKQLIENEQLRSKLAETAYQYTKKHCTTVYNSYQFGKYIKSIMVPNIAFVVPSVQTSGGILVIFKHAAILQSYGYDVTLINDGFESKDILKDGSRIPVVSKQTQQIHTSFDKMVATLWSTLSTLALYPNIKDRYYFVQNFETDFYEAGNFFKVAANQSYNPCFDVNFITISKWCQNWLVDSYEKDASYLPNGIDLEHFTAKKRNFNNNGKIRILVEGNSNDYYKNVDESFRIIEQLDKDKYEIWFMSYLGKPKAWYHVDKFLHKVPYEKVPEVYQQCHILIKSSLLESFSYPPLEMMSTGGYVVVAPNEGNIEYLRDEENCLFYDRNKEGDAVRAIERICSDSNLRDKLYENGIETAKRRDWRELEKEVLSFYGFNRGE
ncbi:lipopolysaccharide biosynthesis protein [Lachnospiraceae bacterium KM106-2]|nr:lipopolysaccharide biosynthesis protein [Lachnospiraceae bacterium KM106-2]